MKFNHKLFLSFAVVCLATTLIFAEEPQQSMQIQTETSQEAVAVGETSKAEDQTVVVESLADSQNVTLDFKEADIRNVLKIISYKSGVNIVTTPEVIGNITIRLVDVPWDKALDVILKTYGFAYEKQANIITVAPIEKLTALKEQEVALAQIQPTSTEVFYLRYIDAQDAKKALDPQLSTRGKITVLETTGQTGWEFGAGDLGKRERINKGRVSRSKTFIISDIPPVLEKIKEILQKIDIKPQQVLIEAKLVEVSHDKLRDIGFNWGTGSGGSTSLTTRQDVIDDYVTTTNSTTGEITQQIFKDVITLPSHAIPLDSSVSKVLGAQSIPAAGVSELLFQKLTGTEFEAVFKALEEKGNANTLSAPHIMTLNNQEASILIGTKFPLLRTTVSSETGSVTGQSLDKYQDIGIQLNVVPQVVGSDNINLIIHPAVSSYSQTIKAVSSTGVTMAEYPIILTREADTQIQLKDEETVVIGGLLTDTKTKSTKGIPILKDIPFLGVLFKQETTNNEKMDLLIFIKAHLVKEGEFSPEEIAKLEQRIERAPENKATTKK
jgi:type IV pilus assembly protein PilQ